MADVELPARVRLAHLPTPLERSPRLGAAFGVELWWKRDDLTGAELSGNKVRKLEFLFADARAQGADTVITCGGVQSNHCRATALAAARLGLGCTVLLRVPDPAAPPPLSANSLLDRLAGATVRYVSVEEYRRRAEIFPRLEAELRAAGRRPYSIPEGGSDAVGAWGYVVAVAELRDQLAAAGVKGPVTLIYAAGSGGTGAGIELGLRLAGWHEARALGFAVCDDRAHFQRAVADIAADACRRFHLPVAPPAAADVAIDDGFIGPGYAQTTSAMLQAIADAAHSEGVVLDPVYTGKAFFGLRETLRREPGRFGPRVVFFHTGGIYGLFPFADQLAPLLDAGR